MHFKLSYFVALLLVAHLAILVSSVPDAFALSSSNQNDLIELKLAWTFGQDRNESQSEFKFYSFIESFLSNPTQADLAQKFDSVNTKSPFFDHLVNSSPLVRRVRILKSVERGVSV